MSAAAGAPEVRIVAGGPVDEAGRAAIVEAVTRVVRARRPGRRPRASAWARAGRLEAIGLAAVRSRAQLPPG